jgi:hypothetical protein
MEISLAIFILGSEATELHRETIALEKDFLFKNLFRTNPDNRFSFLTCGLRETIPVHRPTNFFTPDLNVILLSVVGRFKFVHRFEEYEWRRRSIRREIKNLKNEKIISSGGYFITCTQ